MGTAQESPRREYETEGGQRRYWPPNVKEKAMKMDPYPTTMFDYVIIILTIICVAILIIELV